MVLGTLPATPSASTANKPKWCSTVNYGIIRSSPQPQRNQAGREQGSVTSNLSLPYRCFDDFPFGPTKAPQFVPPSHSTINAPIKLTGTGTRPEWPLRNPAEWEREWSEGAKEKENRRAHCEPFIYFFPFEFLGCLERSHKLFSCGVRRMANCRSVQLIGYWSSLDACFSFACFCLSWVGAGYHR